MKLKNIWNEFYIKIFPVYGLISTFMLITNFIVKNFNLSDALLAGWLFTVISHFLNYKILAKYMSMKGDTIIFYVVYIIESAVMVSIIKIVRDLMDHGQICFYCLFRSIGIVVVFMAAFSAIVFFLQREYTKRMNQKLNEYKQQNDDDADR